ncbi:MAG TPA: YicC/YloC family endoribonuclease [Candidatus Acidoferrales bacterium]|nr:YicC/YloC family endoribonuclease [Candidatus Acidoferrales bacterium]
MLRSMTGYAQAQAEEPPWGLRVTVKALNHRFLDLRLRLPDELAAVEPRLRARVRDRISRGHLEVQFQVESLERRALEVNEEFVRGYLELYRRLQREHQLSGEPDLTAVLRLPGVLRTDPAPPTAEAAEQLASVAERLLDQALERLDEMRRAEGAALEQELNACLEGIRAGQKELAKLSEQAQPAAHRRLLERLRELLGESPVDPTRLAEEAAYLAQRSDVREELTRLASHAEQFAGLLAGDGAVGKRLDFLVQEMHRETSTLLAKAPGLEAEGLEMTRVGLEVKAQVERLREQVQNVE